MTEKRKRTALWKKLVLLLASLIIALAISEGAVRLLYPEYGIPVYTTKLFTEFDPKLGWRKIPNFRGQHVQDEYTIVEQLNSRGQRGPVFPYEKPDDAYRILVMGDSFAEGYTVEFRDLFSEIMSEKLNRNPDKDIEVINVGTGGYGTDQELLFFEDEGSKYQPDLTVLLFFINDLTFNIRDNYTPKGRGQKPLFELKDGELKLKSLPKATWDPDEVRAQDEAKHPTEDSFVPWLPERWYLYRLVRHALTAGTENVIDELPTIPQSVPDVPGPSTKPNKQGNDGDRRMHFSNDRRRREWEMTEALLARLKDRVEAGGGSLLIFYVPVKGEVYNGKREVVSKTSRVESNLGIVAERNGIGFIPTVALFRAEARILAEQDKFLYWKKDPHWTAEGNHLTGLIIAEHIRSHCDRYRLCEPQAAAGN